MLKTLQPKQLRKPSNIFLGPSTKSSISIAKRVIASLPFRRYFLHQNRALLTSCLGTFRAKGTAHCSLREQWAASPRLRRPAVLSHRNLVPPDRVGREHCPAGLIKPWGSLGEEGCCHPHLLGSEQDHVHWPFDFILRSLIQHFVLSWSIIEY